MERDSLRSPEQGGGEVLLNNVPAYAWRHGCGPTALGMVVGFFDTIGYYDLIPGDASFQTEAVNQVIASGGDMDNPRPSGAEEHFEDYALPIDYSPNMLDDDYLTSARKPHVDNSIADYMDTSKSSRNNYYGWSWSSDMGLAFNAFVDQANYAYKPSYQEYLFAYGTMTWSVLTNEIDAGRPMVFLVDSNGDGGTDHFVTVIGYRTSPTLSYASLDTWSTTDVRWENFAGMAPGVPWGINRGWSFNVNQASFDCDSVTDVSIAECEALVSLYNSTNGDEWTNNTNWLGTTNVSEWYGVDVESNNVIGLYLNNNNLRGSLSSRLGNLVELKRLHLESNFLIGEIPPQLGNLGKLEILFLSGNQLSGSIPDDLGNMSSLRWLHLDRNRLSGEIPSELGNLPSLYWLNLWGNRLSGQIPSTLGSISTLERIELSSNSLSGSIPSEIGNLTNLEIIILSNNRLSGDIPESFSNLYNLCTPSNPCPSFMFAGEYGLDLGYNQLNVPASPPQLASFLEEKDPDWYWTQAKFQTINQDGGEIISYKGDVSITVQEGAVSSETNFYFEPRMYPNYSTGELRFAGTNFLLTASDMTSGEPVNTFEPSLVIKIFYDETWLATISEESLSLYYFDYETWGWKDAVKTCGSGEYTRDFEQKSFSVPVCHLSEFAVLGEELPMDALKIYLPLMLK